MNIIAIANQKGGVGKTTTAVNLAAGLAQQNHPTLLIDLDSQCNATLSYLPQDIITITLADVLIGHNRVALYDAIYETYVHNLDIAPASIRLALLERVFQIEEQYRLKDAIESLTGYDFVLIDCPPNLGMVLTQALLAATHVLIPVAAQYYPLEGVVDLTSTIAATRRPNPNLQILGFVLTHFDTRNNICGEALTRIQSLFPGQVLETVIRTNVRLQTAPAYRQAIFEHAPQSHGSMDYLALTQEILQKSSNQQLRVISNAKKKA